ncbi:hypothetical protein SESBI_46598 [Sesbania bispinosa]|nr:hypothetical protein SESBI_46598 [Sesbania bispinosa]
MKAKTCGPEQRDELLLMKSKSERNPGRMFWRCPNWAADDVVCDEGVRVEEWKMLKHENEELKRKIGKLQLKLSCERRRLKLAVCAVVLLMGLSFMVFAVAIVNCDALRKTM